MHERILTLHPEGKEGVKICAQKYKQIRNAILDALDTSQEISFKDLTQSVLSQLQGNFDGSVPWYVTTVKLDLEAREVIRCVRGRGPQKISLV